jgi:acetyltransferase-like isoleucine patch superfamily enzyme
LLVFLIEQLPVLFVLQQMVLYPWYLKHLRGYRDVLMWFLTPGRIAFYIALRVVRSTVCPLLRLLAVLIVKRFIIGKFQAGPWPKSQRAIWKRWLMEQLLPGEKLQEVGNLIGSHYAYMTYVLRLLGAKVGERIYWPGSNFEGLVEYDLLEVEDDVVFGSRSSILCADALEAAPIRIQSGANVSDRCVLLPGCTIGRNATMGSGSLCSRGTAYPGIVMHVLNTALSQGKIGVGGEAVPRSLSLSLSLSLPPSLAD